METTSLRRTTRNIGMRNGKSQGVFEIDEVLGGERAKPASTSPIRKTTGSIRCGPPDPYWRQCPHPYRKELAFASGKGAAWGSSVAKPKGGEAKNEFHIR